MNQFVKYLSVVCLLMLPASGFAADEKTTPHPVSPTGAPGQIPSVMQPGNHPVSEDKGAGATSGKIVETMNSGGYTYLNLEKDGKKTWMAVPETRVKVGQEVSCTSGTEMADFPSKTLKRTFDRIIFCNTPLEKKDGEADVEGVSPGSKGAVVAPADKAKVEKAVGANAYTVGELYKNKAKLDKKKVVVRGKVVKVSAGIMGKNWVHLQDGSGSQKKGTHNLVVTSQDLPAVGDVVTMGGTLYKDKDFGSGYKYDVIVEEAVIKK